MSNRILDEFLIDVANHGLDVKVQVWPTGLGFMDSEPRTGYSCPLTEDVYIKLVLNYAGTLIMLIHEQKYEIKCLMHMQQVVKQYNPTHPAWVYILSIR